MATTQRSKMAVTATTQWSKMAPERLCISVKLIALITTDGRDLGMVCAQGSQLARVRG